MDVFWNIDFGRISEGFWKGFGKPKSLIFAFFRHFFDANFRVQVERAKNLKKRFHPQIIPSVLRYVRAWGEGL